jgi:uncharacterized protein with HEPN domain
MLSAIDKAITFTAGRTRGDLDQNDMLALALVRLLEIVGEAARFVPDEIKDAHPEIPWREIAGTRDRLIHGYFAVDLDIVWSIIKTDLPPLAVQIRSILKNA